MGLAQSFLITNERSSKFPSVPVLQTSFSRVLMTVCFAFFSFPLFDLLSDLRGFLSAETVRIFDLRQRYRSSTSTSISEIERNARPFDDQEDDFTVIPQVSFVSLISLLFLFSFSDVSSQQTKKKSLGGGRVTRIVARRGRSTNSSSLLLDMES